MAQRKIFYLNKSDGVSPVSYGHALLTMNGSMPALKMEIFLNQNAKSLPYQLFCYSSQNIPSEIFLQKDSYRNLPKLTADLSEKEGKTFEFLLGNYSFLFGENTSIVPVIKSTQPVMDQNKEKEKTSQDKVNLEIPQDKIDIETSQNKTNVKISQDKVCIEASPNRITRETPHDRSLLSADSDEEIKYRNCDNILSHSCLSVWDKLANRFGIIHPFSNSTEAISLTPAEIHRFTVKDRFLEENSFLLHGYYQYRHILLYRFSDKASNFHYCIGVPGIYSKQEKIVAEMFGFPEFSINKGKEQKASFIKTSAPFGCFGYYHRSITIKES